jgi:hypothetical protein
MEEFKRKLASVQEIESISPIEGADKIEMCTMVGLGWQCVIGKKDNLKVGDKIIYFEVDSILPEKPEYEFLRERKYRIRTIKLKKQISQGLIIPLPASMQNIPVGTDVTELMGVKKYDPQAQEEATLVVPKHRSRVMQYLMKFKACRYIYLKLNSHEKGEWPQWLSKTDEERIQNCAKILMDNYDKTWYISEKMDGTSFSAFTYNKRSWGIKRRSFGVCSRNIWLKTKHSCNYWNIAEKYDLERKLKDLSSIYTIQGEICGPNIQKNKYNLSELELFVFNVYQDGAMLEPHLMTKFCDSLRLKTVPILHPEFIPSVHIPLTETERTVPAVVNYLVNASLGNSVLLPRKREGIVMRLVDNPRVSFKVINPEFLLEIGE